MDAEVELSSIRGTRVVPLTEFILGNRDTALSLDELVTAILIPESGASGRSSFLKLGARKYLVISAAMVAVRLDIDADRIASAAIAVGACSVVALRLPELESALIGLQTAEVTNPVTPERLADLSPISDVRASAHYREAAAVELVKRALVQAVTE